MRRILTRLTPLLLILATAIFMHTPPAQAFSGNNLMDVGVFDRTNAMNASQIDSWINANFPGSCISTNHGFSSADPTGYNPSQGFLYGGAVSAGQVIYDAAQAY